MTTLNLLTILNHSNNWSDIYTQILKYDAPDKKQKFGKLFEEFCKYYYLNEPTVRHEYLNVWLFSEVPQNIRNRLNLGTVDHGIDLILERQDATFSAVQCKFKTEQNVKLFWSKDKISNFFAESDKVDHLVIFTNASGLDEYSLAKKKHCLKLVALGDLLSITASTIQRIKNKIIGLIPKPVSINKPWDYQYKPIHHVINGFKNHDRGQLILPCGTGKTLISLWIKENLASKHTLVLVPSLALLKQIKNEWSANTERYIPYICVCSEKDINKDKKLDKSVVHIQEISGKVTNNPKEIQEFLTTYNETIVYSTYQSLKVVCESVKNSSFNFDLAICDEAHKTFSKKFGLVHFNSSIPIKKRLYMTATPRVLSDNLKNNLIKENINFLHDMNDPIIFGHEFYRMSFKEAIDKKILTNYKIVAIGINDELIQKAIQKGKYTSDDEPINEIANNYALGKFMQENKAKHAITFHSSVKKAQSFQTRHHKIHPEVSTYHVNGGLTSSERTILIEMFKNSPQSIITNARCLTEGVDIPAVDTIYFCNPRNSKVDIVQAVGRALRKPKDKKINKKIGYIVVPIFHKNEETLEESIEAGNFNNLISIIRSLCSSDERLLDEIKKIQFEQPNIKNKECAAVDNNLHKMLILEGFEEKLKEKLFYQIVNKISLSISLAEKCPELIKEWDFSKNTFDPYKITYGSKKEVTWICKNNHEYKSVIYSRANGHGCPYCTRKKVSIENSLAYKAPHLANTLHPNKNSLTAYEIPYNSNKKAWWLCENNHEFYAPIGNRYRGTKCPYCSGKKAHANYNLATEAPNLIKEWHSELNGTLTPYDVTPGSKIKIWWLCAANHTWEATILNRYNGNGCPYCDGRKVSPSYNFAIKYPQLACEFHLEKNGLKKSSDFTPYSNAKVWWLCNKKHEWKASIGSRVAGNNCPYCSGKKAHATYNLTVLFPDIAKEWHPSLNARLIPDNVTPGSKIKVSWICKAGHIWKAPIYSRTNGHGCMRCRKKIVKKIT